MIEEQLKINVKETLEILSKPWCDVNDIMKLAGCGRNNALKIRKAVVNELENKGYILPTNLVPTDILIKKIYVNLDYITKMIEVNKKINN
jgi:hypothetical protein